MRDGLMIAAAIFAAIAMALCIVGLGMWITGADGGLMIFGE
jgi:hypothetical protein